MTDRSLLLLHAAEIIEHGGVFNEDCSKCREILTIATATSEVVDAERHEPR